MDEFPGNDLFYGPPEPLSFMSGRSAAAGRFDNGWRSKYPWIREDGLGKAFCNVCLSSFEGNLEGVRRHLLTKTHKELASLPKYKKSKAYLGNCSICLKRVKKLVSSNQLVMNSVTRRFSRLDRGEEFVCEICVAALQFIDKFGEMCDIKAARSNSTVKTEFVEEEIVQALQHSTEWVYFVLNQMLETRAISTEPMRVSPLLETFERPREFKTEIKTEVTAESLHKFEYVLIKADPFDPDVNPEIEPEPTVKPAKAPKGPKPERQKYYCPWKPCKYVCMSQARLEKHLLKKQCGNPAGRKKLFICHVCSKGFASKEGVKQHLNFHFNLYPYVCDVEGCDRKYQNAPALTFHKQRTHALIGKKARVKGPKPIPKLICDVCGKKFPTKQRIQYHLNSHFDVTPFSCDTDGCTRKFRNPSRLYTHRNQVHFKIIMYYCEVCGKALKCKSSFEQHVLGHKDPALPCQICGKLLSNKSTMNYHMKTHTGDRKYKCDFPGCNLAFIKKSGLQVHSLKHTGYKPYECPECGERFSYKVVMKKHRVRDHNVDIKFMKKENPQLMPGKNVPE